MRKWLVGLLAAGLCVSSAWAADYTLVESADDLTAGSYVITGNNAADGAEPAMLAQAPDKNYFYPSNVSVSDKVISDPDDNLVWEVAEASGGWTIHSGVGYVSYSGSGNTANAAEDVADNSTWTISVADGVATVANKGTADRKLQYNSGSPRFACYTSNQKLLKFYKAASGPVEFAIKLSPAENFEVVQGKSASITATVRGAQGDVSYSWSVDGTPIDLAGNVYAIDSTEAGGPYEVACEASDGTSSDSASVKYTVVAAPAGVDFELVSSSDGLQDGARYLVTDATHAFAMSSVAVSSALSAVGVTETEGVIKATDESTIWTLVEDADGNFALQNGEKYVGWSSGNAATMQDTAFANKISVAEGVATITAVSDTTRNLKYNKGSPRFAYYTSTQTDLALFKEAGETGLSVSLDKANGFTVELGAEDSITATAKDGTEPYSYVWTSDTPDLNGRGATLAIPATLAEGDYTVQVEVTDAEANKVSKQIGFSVVAPLEPHAINIAVGIQNGTVTSDPEGEAVAGTQVKLTATATTEGYALKEMTVTYGETELKFTTSPATFEMPDEDVSVGAIFAEVKDYATLPFVAENTPYTGPWKTATQSGMTSKGLGTDYMSGGVSVGAKFDTTGDWMQIKFDGTPGELVYAIKGNSISETNNSIFLVQESATGAEDAWNTLATYQTEDGTLTTSQETKTNALAGDSRFVRFIYDTKGAGNVGIYGVYISSGGPAPFSIALDPAEYFEVEVGEEASIAATPKNAEGEVHYEWTVGGESVGSDSAVLGLDTTVATDELEVVCKATDAANTIATATVSYKVVNPPQKYTVTVADGILNGSVELKVDGELVDSPAELAEGTLVTVVATPAAGYQLDRILLDSEDLLENPFTVTGDALISAEFSEVEGDTFVLITSVDDLEDGAEYVITDNTQAYAMKAELSTSSTKRLVNAAVAPVEKVITTGDAALVWKLVKDEDGHFALYSDSQGKYLGWSSGNSVKFQDEAFANTITYESDLFVVMASSTAELEKPRKLQFNSAANTLQFAYYEGGQKNLCFFKKESSTEPKITYTGETTVQLPVGAFSLQFSLKNYEGAFEWVLDSREGGSIDADGLYTWAPTEAEEVTIKVIARNGALDIASLEVALTVEEEPGPQPGEAALVIGGDTTGVVGQPVTITVTPENFPVGVDVEVLPDDATVDGEELQDEDAELVWDDFPPTLTFTPNVAGTFVFEFSAAGGSASAAATATIVVSEEGPGPQPSDAKITKMTIANDKMTIEFQGDGAQVLLSDDLQTWTPVDGAISPFEFNMKEAGKKFIGVR